MESAYDRVRKAVLVKQGAFSQGSAVIISRSGLVLTAAHVTPDTEATFLSSDGRELSGTLLVLPQSGDWAFYKLYGPGSYPWVEIATSRTPNAPVLLVGLSGRWSVGRLRARGVNIPSAKTGGTALANALVHSAPAFKGDSGGGLFDADGRLLGINVAGTGDLFSCAVDAHSFRPFLAALDDLRDWTQLRRRLNQDNRLGGFRRLLRPTLPETLEEEIRWILDGLVRFATDTPPATSVDLVTLTQSLRREALTRVGSNEDRILWLWVQFFRRTYK